LNTDHRSVLSPDASRGQKMAGVLVARLPALVWAG